MDEVERRCKLAECGKVLVRQEGETNHNWARREFCSKSCGSIWGNMMRKRKAKKKRQEGAPVTV